MYKRGSRNIHKIWYDEVRGSFGKANQERNHCERRKSIREYKRWTLKRRLNDLLTFIIESYYVKVTTDAHHLIEESVMREEEYLNPYDNELFDELNKFHTR